MDETTLGKPDEGLVNLLVGLRRQNPLGIADAHRLLRPMEQEQARVYQERLDGAEALERVAAQVYVPSILEAAHRLHSDARFVLDGLAASLGAGRVQIGSSGMVLEAAPNAPANLPPFVEGLIARVEAIEAERRVRSQ